MAHSPAARRGNGLDAPASTWGPGVGRVRRGTGTTRRYAAGNACLDRRLGSAPRLMRKTLTVGRVGSSMTIASGWMIQPVGPAPGAMPTPVGKLGPKGRPGNHNVYFNPFCNIVQRAKMPRTPRKIGGIFADFFLALLASWRSWRYFFPVDSVSRPMAPKRSANSSQGGKFLWLVLPRKKERNASPRCSSRLGNYFAGMRRRSAYS
jgi:hypothetical protein